MLKDRKYISGTLWGVWLWTEVPSEFITRLHLVKTPFGSLAVHWLHKADPEPWLHDHPATFFSLILRGAYLELRQKKGSKITCAHRRWFNWIKASPDDRHRIAHVRPRTTTLCFMGPKRRDWGYYTDDGWMYWKTYQQVQKEEQL